MLMAETPPPENKFANPQNEERTKHLKRASRLIVNSREKMPHSALWHLALRRTLWRYTQEVLLRRDRDRAVSTAATKEKAHGI
jgi:hypothetical protein